jgi:polyphosphate kinase
MVNTLEITASDDAPAVSVGDRPLTDPSLYLNFQLSWLAFNERVLEEAEDTGQPLLERAKFLSIVTSNFDEFFMVRVAALREAVAAGSGPLGDDGLTPTEVLGEVRRRALELSERQLRCFTGEIRPALAAEGVHLLDYAQLDDQQRAELRDRFTQDIAPILTPLAIDTGHPFPFISSQSLNLLVMLTDGRVARLKIPPSLPRMTPVAPGPAQPAADGRRPSVCFVWLEQVVAANIEGLFPGIPIEATYPFRVLRNADVEIEEADAGDLLADVEAMLRARRFGFVTCLAVDGSMPAERADWLKERLGVGPNGTFRLNGPLGLGELMGLLRLDRPDLKDQPLVPRLPTALAGEQDAFSVLRERDVLVHHPYDSFEAVLRFLRSGIDDPDTLAIKQTLYRVGSDSPVVEALAAAREEGTEVAVLVELKARFDEQSNVGWAQSLEAQGVHVVYGLPSLKVHSKLTMIVRRDEDGFRRYLHLGTGNYNASTARLYTDLGLLTSRAELGNEVAEIFNYLTGYSAKVAYQQLLVSPLTARERLEALVMREIQHASAGRPARLIFKMNQLTDGPMIRALYRASQAGVEIDLLVRGVCCLRPGVPGVSETIRVRSIVGRFLEHSRIYSFRNGGDDEVYLGSADLMERNLDRRVEVIFPVQDATLRKQVRDRILEVQLRDTAKSRELQADGTYQRVRPVLGSAPFDSQAWFCAHSLDEPIPA